MKKYIKLIWIFTFVFYTESAVKDSDILLNAIRKKQVDIVEKLIESGTALKESDFTALFHTLSSGWCYDVFAFFDLDMLDLFIKAGADINVKSTDGSTILLKVIELNGAVGLDAYKVIKALLNLNADVNIENKYGQTPLYEAVLHGSIDILDLLYNHGAVLKANFKEVDLHTWPRKLIEVNILDKAVKRRNLEIVNWLILKGIPVTPLVLYDYPEILN